MGVPHHQGGVGNSTIAFGNGSDGRAKIIELFGSHEFWRTNLSRLIYECFDCCMNGVPI